MSTAAISPSILKAATPAVPAKGQSGSAKTATRATAASPAAASATPVISAAAAALKEVSETSAQTAREAASGDHQAQNLLAKQSAASAARTGSASASDPLSTKGTRISVKA